MKTLGGDKIHVRERSKPYVSNKADARSYEGIVFRRSGTGESKPTCGLVTFTGACSDRTCNVSKPKPIPRRCYRYDCPECYHSAIHRMAVKSADRLNSFPFKLKEETGLWAGRMKHFVFSFDPNKWRRERCISDAGKGMMKHLDKALRYAAKDGFYAFEVMIHLQREQHKDGSYCDRENCDIPASEHVWTFGPHVHAVGYGHLMSTQELHGNPEFRSINIIQVPEASGQERDAYATLYYQGTHASVFYRQDTQKQASRLVKHLGHISPRIYKQKAVGCTCDVAQCDCGKPLKVYGVRADLSPDRNYDFGPLLERKPIFEYRFDHRKLAVWMREREYLGRLWLSRRARAMRESLPPKGTELGRSPDGGIPPSP